MDADPPYIPTDKLLTPRHRRNKTLMMDESARSCRVVSENRINPSVTQNVIPATGVNPSILRIHSNNVTQNVISGLKSNAGSVTKDFNSVFRRLSKVVDAAQFRSI